MQCLCIQTRRIAHAAHTMDQTKRSRQFCAEWQENKHNFNKRFPKCLLTTQCPLDITWKDFLPGGFLNEKLFCSDWPYFIRNYLLFSVSVLCSQICTLKLNLHRNIGLTYAISIVNDFLEFCLWKYFLLFFAEFKIVEISQQFCKKIIRIEQTEFVENLSAFKLHTLQTSA